jgi:hypothetical protein
VCLKRCLCVLLVVLTLSSSQSWAQQAPATGNPPDSKMSEKLRVLVLEGEHGLNDTERSLPALTVVEVRDENDRPIENADVTFRLPPSGPGGTFPGQKFSRTVRTNPQGQAATTGFTPNHELGEFAITVTATYGTLMGRATIHQTNEARVNIVTGTRVNGGFASKWGKWKWIAAAGLTAGAVVGIVLATRGGNSSGSGTPTTVIISPGPIVIGVPQ